MNEPLGGSQAMSFSKKRISTGNILPFSISDVTDRFSTRRDDSFYEYLGLTTIQRYTLFVITNLISFVFFMLAVLKMPIAMLKLSPHLFVFPYSIGSVIFVASLGLVIGFKTYLKEMVVRKRVVFSVLYFFSTIFTVYVSMNRGGYWISVVCALIQLASSIMFIASYVPGGTKGMSSLAHLSILRARETVGLG